DIPAVILKSIEIELVEHMDQVLRKALVLENPEDYLRRPAADVPRAPEPPPPQDFATEPDPDLITHRQYRGRLVRPPLPSLAGPKGERGMTKADLTESLATKLDLQKTLAERIVNTMFDDIEAALQKGDKVNISGFGTFAVSARKARQ